MCRDTRLPATVLTFVLSVAAAFSQTQEYPNPLIPILSSGKAILGIFSGEKTATQGALMGKNKDVDFVFYSLEQGPFDIPQMLVYITAMRQSGGDHPVMLRIPPIRDGRDAAQQHVAQALDAGVHVVVFPHVETADEAAFAVGTMRYPDAQAPGPKGTRPLGTGAAPRMWGLTEDEYRRQADLWPLNPRGRLLSMVLIEDRVGVANARAIAATAGVSIVCPGPGDLRRAYDRDAGAVEQAIQTVLSACKEFNVPCGITAGPEDIGERLRQGFRVLIVTRPEALTVGRQAATGIP